MELWVRTDLVLFSLVKGLRWFDTGCLLCWFNIMKHILSLKCRWFTLDLVEHEVKLDLIEHGKGWI